MSSVWGKWSDDMQEEKKRRRRTADGSSHWSEGKMFGWGAHDLHTSNDTLEQRVPVWGERERERNGEGKRQKDDFGWICLDAALLSYKAKITKKKETTLQTCVEVILETASNFKCVRLIWSLHCKYSWGNINIEGISIHVLCKAISIWGKREWK